MREKLIAWIQAELPNALPRTREEVALDRNAPVPAALAALPGHTGPATGPGAQPEAPPAGPAAPGGAG